MHLLKICLLYCLVCLLQYVVYIFILSCVNLVCFTSPITSINKPVDYILVINVINGDKGIHSAINMNTYLLNEF